MHDRVPPTDEDAEVSVLGALMLDPAMIDVVADVLTPDDFSREQHRYVYGAMLVLQERREPIDSTTLAGMLREQGRLQDVGGLTFLAGLLNAVPSAAAAPSYARLVKARATQRRLYDAARRVEASTLEPVADVPALLAEAERAILAVGDGVVEAPAASCADTVQDAAARLERAQADTEHRIPTGFPTLDRDFGGYLRGTLVVVGARPGAGKTIFAMATALRGAAAAGIGVLHRSLEMTRAELALRAFADACSIPNWRLQRGVLDERDYAPIATASGALMRLPWFIRDQAAEWQQDVRAYERMLRQRPDIGVLIVDHVGLVRGVGGNVEHRHLVIGEITSSLAALARRRNIVVIALSQLNRATEKEGREPMLSDLRESGSLEQDASLVLFLHPVDKDARGDAPQQLDIIVAKNRQGRTGKHAFRLHKQFCRLLDPFDDDHPTILQPEPEPREWFA